MWYSTSILGSWNFHWFVIVRVPSATIKCSLHACDFLMMRCCKINCFLFKETSTFIFSSIPKRVRLQWIHRDYKKQICMCVSVCVWDVYALHLLTRRLRMPLGCNIFGSSLAVCWYARILTYCQTINDRTPRHVTGMMILWFLWSHVVGHVRHNGDIPKKNGHGWPCNKQRHGNHEQKVTHGDPFHLG